MKNAYASCMYTSSTLRNVETRRLDEHPLCTVDPATDSSFSWPFKPSLINRFSSRDSLLG
jgi:hypothetical protein